MRFDTRGLRRMLSRFLRGGTVSRARPGRAFAPPSFAQPDPAQPDPARPSPGLPLPPFPPPVPARELVVIGDVHGTLAPFARLLARIRVEHPGAAVIQVGDLIDRGEDSAGVLRLAFAQRADLVVLLGNHEEMLLRFLDDPAAAGGAAGERWLRNGGLQTLASFGLGPVPAAPDAAQWVGLRDRLRAALGPEIEAWLRGLPRLYESGTVVVSHAGADPWLPMARQPAEALTWGGHGFGRRRRTDGIWVVHGHVIVPEARCRDGVISVDTGAFASGRLSAAVVSAGACRFLLETA